VKQSTRLMLLLAMLTAGCDSEPEPADELVGTWLRTEPGGTVEAYDFAADGTLIYDYVNELDGPKGQIEGTYTADGEQLVIDGTEHNDIDAPRQVHKTRTYFVNDRLFASSAFLPVGDHVGIVGTWSLSSLTEIIASDGTATVDWFVESRITLNADGTLHIVEDRPDSHVDVTGTYVEPWPGFVNATLDFGDQGTATLQALLIDDAALIQYDFHRGT
jgi:hypothetical protein